MRSAARWRASCSSASATPRSASSIACCSWDSGTRRSASSSTQLLLALGTPYVLAAPLAFAAGAVNGYVFNRRWTFVARDSTRARVLYVAVQAVGAVSTSLLVLLFVEASGTGKVWAYLAAIPPVTLCMFAANRLWTFPERAELVA
jgi:putative flippase GtrA